jgi:hypothetical protein
MSEHKQMYFHFLPRIDAAELKNTLKQIQDDSSPGAGVCVFLPEAKKDQVGAVQAACREASMPVVGAVFPLLTKDGDFFTDGVWVIRFDEMPYFLLEENVPTDPDAVEQKIDDIVADIYNNLDDDSETTLFMMFDALLPNISTFLDGFYLRLANRVHYAGVNAGSETFKPTPCLFDSNKLISNGMLLFLLKKHKGAILEHGYHAPREMVYATSSENNCISQIDWQPAFDVYRKLVREQYGVELNKENFYSLSVHYPFGIVRADHHVVVRIPVTMRDDGSLLCIGEIPKNSVLTLLERPQIDTDETVNALLNGLNNLYGNVVGRELLLFCCSARRMHFGVDTERKELGRFKSITGASQVAGALTLGEIGSSTLQGYPIFQNASLVALCPMKKTSDDQ